MLTSRHLAIAATLGVLGNAAAERALSASQQPAPQTVIRGNILGPDGLQVVGATVEAGHRRDSVYHSRSVRTNADGNFTILFAPAAPTYTIRVTAPGLADTSIAVTPTPSPQRPTTGTAVVYVQLRRR